MMNNKGFAITGIIYTLFIIFLLILLSVLSGVSSFQRLMINSVDYFESSFKGVKIEKSGGFIDKNEALVLGKYIFKMYGKDDCNNDGFIDDDVDCFAYLNKGNEFNRSNVVCDFNKNGIYSSSSSSCSNIMKLIEVYSFEGNG